MKYTIEIGPTEVEPDYDGPAIREQGRKEGRKYRGILSGHVVKLARDVAEFSKHQTSKPSMTLYTGHDDSRTHLAIIESQAVSRHLSITGITIIKLRISGSQVKLALNDSKSRFGVVCNFQ